MEENQEEVKVAAPSMVDDANETARRLEAANKDYRALVERQEALAAHNALGGTTDAGTKPEEPKEESDEDYANKVMANDI